jgi:hypothetical protein
LESVLQSVHHPLSSNKNIVATLAMFYTSLVVAVIANLHLPSTTSTTQKTHFRRLSSSPHPHTNSEEKITNHMAQPIYIMYRTTNQHHHPFIFIPPP